VFKTKDGYINIAASGGHIYKRFCESIKAPELMTDERFSTDKARAKNRDVLNAEIDKRVATYGSAELVEKLNKAGVPAGPIYKMDEMFADPAGQASQDGPSREVAQARSDRGDRPGHQHEPHALRDALGHARAGRAYRGRAEGVRLRRRGDRQFPPAWRYLGGIDDQSHTEHDRREAWPGRQARLQQAGQAQCDVLRHVGGDPRHHGRIREGSRHPRRGGDRGGRPGLRLGAADISEFEKARSTPEQVAYYDKIGEIANARLAKCSKPTIARIRGFLRRRRRGRCR